MVNYFTTFVYTDGAAFPNTKGINSTTPTTQDGTEFVKAFIDDLWGFNQALMDYAGLTPDGVTEAAGASQRLEAIQKGFIGPGEIVEWNLADDPATVGRRRLLLNGQGILRANYPDLDAAVYVGDSANPTASAYYHADDAAGTSRNTAGAYLILPDRRGYVPRGLDTAASVDPDGASRDVGSIQNDALQGHWHNIQTTQGTDQIAVDTNATGASANGNDMTWGGAKTDPRVETTSPVTDGVNGTPRTSSETRMINIATKWVILY